MKKTICIFILVLVFLSSIIFSAFAYESEISVFINDERIEFDVSPMLINNRTMVPLRLVFEKLGAKVIWDAETNTVEAYNDENSVLLTIGSVYMETSDDIIKLDAPAMLYNDRTLIPIRAVSEAFLCDVVWDEDTESVKIYTPEFKHLMQQTVKVATAKEFLENIGSNKRIVLTSEYYNLSEVINSKNLIENPYIRDFNTEAFCSVIVYNVDNMTITGNAEIVIDDIYNDVISFTDCENITLFGLKVGHVEQMEEYSCEGSVLRLNNCNNVSVEKCELYGCGAIGIDASAVTGLNINECKIYDCSYTGIWLQNGSETNVENAEFYDCSTYSGFVRIDNSTFLCNNSKIHNITAPTGTYDTGFVDTFDFDGKPSVIRFSNCEFTDNIFDIITNPETVNLVFEKCNFINNQGVMDGTNAFFIN